MINSLIGIFIVLHGLVHLLYVGQSQKAFELQPKMTWPEGSWAFSRLVGNSATRVLASTTCVLAAIGFVVGGIGLLFGQVWWRSIVAGMAIFSTVLYVLFWNGKMKRLDNQGLVAILINLALLAAALQWNV